MSSTYLLIYKLLPKYLFEKKSVLQFSILMILLFLFTSFIDRSFIAFVDRGISGHNELFTSTFYNLQAIIRNALILLAVMGMATIIRFYRIHLSNEGHQHALIEDNLQNQLTFFKAQVSPHFLFNALNNIYSESVRKKEYEIASSIEHLSGIMRYLTYDCNAKFVSLDKEVELLKNYINVERMRFSSSDELIISFITEGNFEDQVIAPVLLLPLVENVFKHGVKLDESCFFYIKLTCEGESLFFETRNIIAVQPADYNGVGLSNVKKRLRLLYEDRHEINYYIDGEDFVLTLRIDLNEKH